MPEIREQLQLKIVSSPTTLRQNASILANSTVEFYLYPTVGTVLIHSVKPELTEDVIEYGRRSN